MRFLSDRGRMRPSASIARLASGRTVSASRQASLDDVGHFSLADGLHSRRQARCHAVSEHPEEAEQGWSDLGRASRAEREDKPISCRVERACQHRASGPDRLKDTDITP
jgi:hypothetical protein